MRRYLSSQLSYAFATETSPTAPPSNPALPTDSAIPTSDNDPVNHGEDEDCSSLTPELHPTTGESTAMPPTHKSSVRKYLFSSPSIPTSSPASEQHSANVHRRRNVPPNSVQPDSPSYSPDNHESTSAPIGDAATHRRHAADYPGLRELVALCDKTLGPVGQLKDNLAKRLPHDRLIETLNASVHDRNRLLIQFLRARSHNASEAFAMITSSLRWRSTVDLYSFLHNPDPDAAAFPSCFPLHVISTPENSKQPVVYGLIRLLDRRAERVPFHNALLTFLESSYYGATYVDDEMIVILDFRDWSIRKNAPYRLVKDALQTLQDYYPERLGRVFLLNYPTSIRAAYTVISPVIDSGAKEKIVWIPDVDPSITLSKYLTPKAIPSFLGGSLQTDFPPAWPDIEAETLAART